MWLASQAGPDPKNIIPNWSFFCVESLALHTAVESRGNFFHIPYMDSTFHIAYSDDASLFMRKMKTGRPVKFYRH